MIPIFRGDDTNFNDALFLTVKISATFDLSGFTAELVLGGGAVVKNTVLDENGAFEVVISAEESKLLPFGEVKGSVILIDKQSRRRTIANDILFNVTNEVTEGLEYTADLSVTETEATVLNIKVGGGTGGGTTDYNELENKPSIAGVTLMKDVSLADIGAASSGDIAQSTQAILTAESENTTAILENAEENKSAILTNASENTSAIKANTDAKASEILTAVDESETAITSAVSAAQADIKADIAELKENAGGGSSVSLDAAFMEVLSGLDKQKQILAQALNDKGANVDSTNTLDEMAGAVKTLEVVGEKTNLKGTVLYGRSDSGSMFSDTSCSKILPLTLHRLYAYFNAKTKTFSILKVANDFTYETLASVTLTDSLINTNVYYNYIEMFSNTDETKIVLRTQSTEGSYSFRCYSFDVIYGATVSVEQIGQAVGFTTFSNQVACNGAVSPDGKKFFSFQQYYQRAQAVDFISGTSTEFTFACDDSYAYGNNSVVLSYKVDESGFGVAVFGYAGEKAAYKMQFDFVNNNATYLGAVYLPSAKISNRNHNYWYCPYLVAKKGLVVLLIGDSTDSSQFSVRERYFQSPVEFIVLNTKTGETVSQMVFKTCIQGNPYSGICGKSGDSYFYAKMENGRYLIGAAKRGVVEYDAETNQVYACGTDTVLTDGDFIGQVSMDGRNGMYNPYNQTPIVSFDTRVLYGKLNNSSTHNSFDLYGSYYRAVVYPQVVWGELYKRNGNEIVRTSFFEPSLYEAGAYAEKDSVAVVNVESGEAE